MTQLYSTRLLAGLAVGVSTLALAGAAVADTAWGGGGGTTTSSSDGCTDKATVVVKIGGKCAGVVDNVSFETTGASPAHIKRGNSLASSAPKGGELQITIDGKLPTDLDTWNAKGVNAEAEDITIVEWSDDHKLGYQEDFKHVLLGKVTETTPKTGGKTETHATASTTEKPHTTMHFVYQGLTETQLSSNGKSEDVNSCPPEARIILKIDGHCAGFVDDLVVKSHETPPKTYKAGDDWTSSDQKTDPKTKATSGKFDVTLVGLMPTALDTWSGQGSAASPHDITIISHGLGGMSSKVGKGEATGDKEYDFTKVTLTEASTKITDSKAGSAPKTTLYFSYADLKQTTTAASTSTSGGWGQ